MFCTLELIEGAQRGKNYDKYHINSGVIDSGNERYGRSSELITANIYRLERGMDGFEADDYYSETPRKIEIALDRQLTPAQNAQKYYTEYRKAKTAEEKLRTLIAQGEEELVYLIMHINRIAPPRA